ERTWGSVTGPPAPPAMLPIKSNRGMDMLRGPHWGAVRCWRPAAHRQIHDRADDTDHQRYSRQCGRPQRLESEERIQRVESRPSEREQDRDRRIQNRHLDAVGRREESFAAVNRDGSDDHDGEQQCRADRAEKTQCDQETGDEFAHGGQCREQAAWTEAELFEKPASPRESVATEPAEQFLCAMGADAEANDEARDEQCCAEHVSPSRVDGLGRSFDLSQAIARVMDYLCLRR